MQIYFRRKTKNTIISKIKTEQHLRCTVFHGKSSCPDAEKLWQISLCINVFFIFTILNNFSGFIASKVHILFWELKIQATVNVKIHHYKQFFQLYSIKSSYIVLGIKNPSESKRKNPSDVTEYMFCLFRFFA
jgi:hypothetical protein